MHANTAYSVFCIPILNTLLQCMPILHALFSVYQYLILCFTAWQYSVSLLTTYIDLLHTNTTNILWFTENQHYLPTLFNCILCPILTKNNLLNLSYCPRAWMWSDTRVGYVYITGPRTLLRMGNRTQRTSWAASVSQRANEWVSQPNDQIVLVSKCQVSWPITFSR